ncbi:MAG: putative polymerase, sigma-24 subunit, subfamily [Myxococcales bacterium]|nr:putative polymerase, sigma-24 subunit, subfamily [Myxococcales bacterium]
MLDRGELLLLRELAPRALAAIVRRYRDFTGAEDAVQEALVAAAQQWPVQGLPNNPLGWLIQVASRRITDEIRAATARRLRERLVVSLIPADEQIALVSDEVEVDETLELFWMCCHPALSSSSQVALTLRALGGLTTAEIARAFLVPEATMAQRISRAKQSIKASTVGFAPPAASERADRLPAILHVLYLIFNEGYAATSGEAVVRVDLSHEAIRIVRMLAGSADAPEVHGLLALMLLTDARRDARVGPSGELVPLDAQDRSRWNRAAVAEGTALLERTLTRGAIGPYQVQAAIAALHDEAPSTDATDWRQILALYDVLVAMTDSPMARLSKAIALAMVSGPVAGLAELDRVADDPRIRDHHRIAAARAHLLERAGDRDAAIAHYRLAANLTASTPERNYLLLHAARLEEAAT